MALKRTATLVNRETGERISVSALGINPSSRRYIWVDNEGKEYFEVNNDLRHPLYAVEDDSAEERIRIGKELAELRRKDGITLRDLASKTGIDFSNLSKMEKGINSPTIDILSALCKYYNRKIQLVPIDDSDSE